MAATRRSDGWPALFTVAFRNSSNAMSLVDEQRRHVEVNGALLKLTGHRRETLVGRHIWELVVGGPLFSPEEWTARIHGGDFTGRADLACADSSRVSVQWAAHPVTTMDHRLVLFVALSTSRWGAHFRRTVTDNGDARALSPREREIVELVALGHSGPEIAMQLHISAETVRTHMRNAMSKTGARSRAHLVAKALADGAIAV
jgi:PAS domain S-box-containing protein